MEENSTQNSLIKLIYNELDTCEAFKLKKNLLDDKDLATEYRDLKKTISLLNANDAKPSETSVNNILNIAKRSNLEKSIF